MLALEDIEAASERIADLVVETPIDRSGTFSDLTGASVYLKLEVFQRTGAFKLRGAANRIRTLSPSEREAGVVTASAGNHAQGVALAATESGVDATVVMPEEAAISKVSATRSYGAEVRLEGVDYSAAQAIAYDLAESEGRTYVHAFDDPAIMAGQGTIGLEILDAVPDVDTVLVPIGGGGLIGGIATAIKERNPEVRIVGVQAEGAASVPQSLKAGQIVERDDVDTIADGIATRRVGDLTFEVMQAYVDTAVTVSDDEIAHTLTHLLEREKILVEPAGVVGLAALHHGRIPLEPDEVVVPVLSGGNVDLNVLTTIILRGLVETGRYVKLRTVLKDRPGALEHLSGVIGRLSANIFAIRHDRTSKDVAMNAAEVELEIETRGPAHVQEVIDGLEAEGYEVELNP